jgi:Flp pilus assembly protein TadD
LEAALTECEAALRLASDWAEAHNLHGIILEGLGRRPEALAAYAEAIRLDLAFQEAQENLAELEADLARSIQLYGVR